MSNDEARADDLKYISEFLTDWRVFILHDLTFPIDVKDGVGGGRGLENGIRRGWQIRKRLLCYSSVGFLMCRQISDVLHPNKYDTRLGLKPRSLQPAQLKVTQTNSLKSSMFSSRNQLWRCLSGHSNMQPYANMLSLYLLLTPAKQSASCTSGARGEPAPPTGRLSGAWNAEKWEHRGQNCTNNMWHILKFILPISTALNSHAADVSRPGW